MKSPTQPAPGPATARFPDAGRSQREVDADSRVLDCRIMMVDDVEMNLNVLCAYLRDEGYHRFIRVTNSTEAITGCYREDPDLVILDLMMPQVSGLDILDALRADDRFAHLPVLILTASDDSSLKKAALDAGATDFLSKPIVADDLIPRVRNCLKLKLHHDTLENLVRERTRELEESRVEVIHCLARAAERRDDDTGSHIIRVSKYVGIIARQLGMEDDVCELLALAAILHDVGKIGIVDSILLNPGRLTWNEFDVMKKHCHYGHMICNPAELGTALATASSNGASSRMATILGEAKSPLLQIAGRIALTHHEKWDGTGYPRGLAGESIPIEGRITAVADVFDALSTKRPYKPAFPCEKCFAILADERGGHFDPRVVDAFLDRRDEVLQVYAQFADPDSARLA